MRRNCMEIFHFVALMLKDMPLFEHDSQTTSKRLDYGAIYNDYDCNPTEMLKEKDSGFSYVQIPNVTVSTPIASIVPQQAIDYAVLEADKHESILYEHCTFDSDLFDCESSKADIPYMSKVFEILTSQWTEFRMTNKTLEVFQMRLRNDWQGPDTVYDAWLLTNKYERSWFSYKDFVKRYPGWEAYRKRILEQSDTEESSSSSENESGSEYSPKPSDKYDLVITASSPNSDDQEVQILDAPPDVQKEKTSNIQQNQTTDVVKVEPTAVIPKEIEDFLYEIVESVIKDNGKTYFKNK